MCAEKTTHHISFAEMGRTFFKRQGEIELQH